MEFARSVDPIVRMFFICGLSCYPSLDGFVSTNFRKNPFLRYIPTAGFIALVMFMGSFAHHVVRMHASGWVVTFPLWVYLLNPMVTVSISAISMIFLSRYFEKIFSRINTIERLSRPKFSIDPKTFRRLFMRRIYIISITFIVPTLVGLTHKNIDRRVMLTVSVFMRVFVTLTLMHSFFYIELLDHLLHCFVRHTNKQAASSESPINACSLSARESLIEISQYKLLHFHLWKLSRIINKLFGWTNIVVIFHSFFVALAYMHNLNSQRSRPVSVHLFCKSKLVNTLIRMLRLSFIQFSRVLYVLKYYNWNVFPSGCMPSVPSSGKLELYSNCDRYFPI